MSRLTRLMFVLSFYGFYLLIGLGLVVLLAATPELALVAGVMVVIALWKGGGLPRLRHGNIFGDARWMEPRDAVLSGALESRGGLPVGSIPPPPKKEAMRLLREVPGFLSRYACRVAAAALAKRPLPVYLHDWINLAVVAPPNVGKTSAIIIPAILSLRWSCVALDIKGEICQATIRQRIKMGSRIAVLDPFGVTGLPSERLNPLSGLRYTDANVTDDARAVAESLVTRTGKEHDPHWADSAVVVLRAVILYLVWRCHHTGTPQDQTLAAVFHLIANPDKLNAAMEHMRDGCDGHAMSLSDSASQVLGFVDKERASVMSTALRALAFVQTANVKAATADSTFDPALLRSGFLTVYLVIPPDKLKSHAGLTRVWINCLMTAMVRAGEDRRARVLWCLDEYAAIGRMEIVEQALTQFRAYGSRLIFAFQSVSQMNTAFPEGGSEHVLANCSALFMATRDFATAKLQSDMIGQHTATKYGRSGGTSGGATYGQTDGTRSTNYGYSDNWSEDVVATELVKPSQVLQLGARKLVLLHQGLPPAQLDTHRHYEREWHRVFGPGPGTFGLFLRAALSLAVVAAGAFGLLTVGLPAAVKGVDAYRQKAAEIRRQHGPQAPAAGPPDPDSDEALRSNPLVVKDAFGQIARHADGRPVFIPPGMHVEHDPRTGTAWLVRNGDRMFR